MAFKMKGSAFKLGNVATKSALKQDATKFGYHNEDGSVNEEAIANIPAAEQGYQHQIGPSGSGETGGISNLPEGVDPNAKMIRETFWNKGDQKKADKLKKKEKRSSNRRSAMEKIGDFITGRNKVRTKRPRGQKGINLVTGGKTTTSRRTGRTRQN